MQTHTGQNNTDVKEKMIILNHDCIRLISLSTFTKCSDLLFKSIVRSSEQK